ncbi:MAG: response regulator [Rhodospirillales bacterium]|nr:MAG: response regulator [Rhodospirillales bacterium]
MTGDRIVHVVDDDLAVRQSLAFLLSTAGIAVRVHESARSFLGAPDIANAGCVITDIRMPEMDGIELQRELNARPQKVPVIVITGHGDVALAVQAMKAGAVDFIEKPFDDDALIGAVLAALDRRAREAERDAAAAEAAARLGALSERERQVLDGLLAGQPNKVIAHELGISPRTVEIHRANLMTKMRAASLSDLVRLALMGGATGDG